MFDELLGFFGILLKPLKRIGIKDPLPILTKKVYIPFSLVFVFGFRWTGWKCITACITKTRPT